MPKIKLYTLWIALLIIIIFVLQQVVSGFTDLFVLDQNSVPQVWRFLTAVFLHGSLSHLIANLFALVIFGLILEKLIGSNKFIIVFLVSGILANIIALNFYPSSLGASGAIFGLIGALTIIRPLMGIFAFGMIIPMFVAAIAWILIDIMGIFIPDNVGHIAHLSGIVFGMIFGIFFRVKHESRKKRHKVDVPEHLMRRWEALYMGAD